MAHTVVGLDIGSSGIRAAELSGGGRRTASLHRFASVDLPAGAVRAGKLVDADAVTEALRELWERGRFSSRAVSLGVANDGVLVRQLDLEWMPAADFRKALRYLVADSLPVPVDQANLDYYLLDREAAEAAAGQDEKGVARVLLVAASREMVDDLVRAVRAAGLRPERVDLVPFALVRAACPTLQSSGPPEAVVDIGAETISVVVHEAGRPRFVRTIAGLGGDTVTRALEERYSWTWEEAERTKVVLGLPGSEPADGPEGEAADVTPPGGEHPAQQTILTAAEGLVGEVQATLAWYGDAGRPARVRLSGNGARLRGLQALMTDRLGVPVEGVGLAERVRVRRRVHLEERDEARLAVAAGLVLGGLA